MTNKERKPVGALIGSVIVIVVLVLSCVYLWNTRIQPRINLKYAPETQNANAILHSADVSATEAPKQRNSDNISDIEKDLENTKLDELNKEVQAL